MKNIRLSINEKLYHDGSNPLVNYIVKSIDDPAWDYASKSIWSNINNAIGSSGVFLPRGVVNIIKYKI